MVILFFLSSKETKIQFHIGNNLSIQIITQSHEKIDYCFKTDF